MLNQTKYKRTIVGYVISGKNTNLNGLLVK